MRALFLLLVGCRAPPDAPRKLDLLCAWLFSHHRDDDPAWMEAGIANLEDWLQGRREKTYEGYTVSGLDDDTVDNLDDNGHSVEDIFGVAVGFDSDHDVDEAAKATARADQSKVHPDSVEDYSRTELGDLDCFFDHDCDRHESIEEYTVLLPFSVTSQNVAHNEFLWVNREEGDPAMVHRAWLVEPPVVEPDWLVVHDQYYLDLFVPTKAGNFRLQVTWMVNEQGVVPQDMVMNMVVEGLITHSEELEAWLDG